MILYYMRLTKQKVFFEKAKLKCLAQRPGNFFLAKLSSDQKFRLLGCSLPWESLDTFWTHGWTDTLPPWAQCPQMDIITLLPQFIPWASGPLHTHYLVTLKH